MLYSATSNRYFLGDFLVVSNSFFRFHLADASRGRPDYRTREKILQFTKLQWQQ